MSFGSPVSDPMGPADGDFADVFGQSLSEFDVWKTMQSPEEKRKSRRQLEAVSEGGDEEHQPHNNVTRSRKSRSDKRRSRTNSTTSTRSKGSSTSNSKRRSSSDYKKPKSSRRSNSRSSSAKETISGSASVPDTADEILNASAILSLAPVLSEMEILDIARQQQMERSKQAPVPDYDKYTKVESDEGAYGSDFYSDDDDDGKDFENETDDKIGILMQQLKKEKEVTSRRQPQSMRGLPSFRSSALGDGSNHSGGILLSPEVKARRKMHKLSIEPILKNKGENRSPSSSPTKAKKATLSLPLSDNDDSDEEERMEREKLASSRRVCFNKPHTAASLREAVKEKLTVSSIRAGMNSSAGNASYIRRSSASGKERRDSVRDSLKSFLDAPPSGSGSGSRRALSGSVSVEGIRSVRSAPAPSSGRRLIGRAPRMRSSRRLLTQKAAKEAGGSSSRRLSSSPGLDVHFNNQRVHSTEDGEHRSVYSAPAGSFRDNTLTNKFRKMNMNF